MRSLRKSRGFMYFSRSFFLRAFFGLVALLFTMTVSAADTPDGAGLITVVDEGGAEREVCVLEKVGGGFDLRETVPQVFTPASTTRSRTGSELWRVEDWDGAYGAIADDVAIAGNGTRIFVGWYLNYERFSLFSIDSDTPLWEYTLAGPSAIVDGPVRVAISADGSDLVGGVSRRDTLPTTGQYSRVYKFGDSVLPSWQFNLPTEPALYHLVEVDISDDGSTVGVVAVDNGSTTGKVYVLDSDDGTVLNEWDFDYAASSTIYNVALTEDGSRLVVGCRDLIHVYDNPGGLLQTIVLPYDCQCSAVISPGGDHIAVGNLRGRLDVYELNGGSGEYEPLWFYTITPDYYYPWIQTVALADDDSRVFVGSYQPNQTEQHGYTYIFNMDSSTPIWVSEDSGDLVETVACSADGGVVASASWGDFYNTIGWRYEIAGDSGPLYTVTSTDFSGSFFAADIDDLGNFAAGGTKRVHARTTGSGGFTFAFTSGEQVDTVSADLGCVPDSGVLPFTSQFSVTLGNAVAYYRTVAGRINLTLAGGATYQSWRAGYTNLDPNETFVTAWMQTLPALGSLAGSNVFELHAADVTPSPYNQPPYPLSGDTDTATCTVTGIAP